MADVTTPQLVGDGDHEEGTLGPLEVRRLQVVRYRLQRYPQAQIAQLLGVDQSTISRDLTWVKKRWKDLYGFPSGLDVTQEVGRAIAVFDLIEAQALRDMDLTKRSEVKARTAYARTALMAAQMRINLLGELGFTERKSGDLPFTFRADAIRSGLQRAGLLVTDRLAQLDRNDVAHDEVERWLLSGRNPDSAA